jgi:hypothetical protein
MMEAFYVLSKVIALLASLATMTVLIAIGHPYWAIYPAVLSALATMAVLTSSSVPVSVPFDD